MRIRVEVETVTGWASERERIRIIAERRARWSLTIFAALIGCDRSHWSAIEHGRRPLSPQLAATAIVMLDLGEVDADD